MRLSTLRRCEHFTWAAAALVAGVAPLAVGAGLLASGPAMTAKNVAGLVSMAAGALVIGVAIFRMLCSAVEPGLSSQLVRALVGLVFLALWPVCLFSAFVGVQVIRAQPRAGWATLAAVVGVLIGAAFVLRRLRSRRQNSADACPRCECGYDLTGLPRGGLCPECGKAADEGEP